MARSDLRPAWWTWLVLLLAFVGVNARFFVGRAYIPYDSTDAFLPQTQFVVRSLLRGDAPWWNPLSFAGIPVLADPQGMIFTPHTLTGVLSGPFFGQMVFDLTTLACLLVGAAAVLVYGRRIGGNQAACLLGAVLFMLGGVASSRLQHVIQIISYSTIPVVLLAVQHLCLRPGAGRALLLALAGLVLVLNPNQVVYLGVFALLPFGLLHMMRSPRPLAAALYTAAAGTAVILLSLPMFASIAETIGSSTRNGMSVGESAISSFPAINMLSLFLPGLYGALGPDLTSWAPTDVTQDYLYIGILPGIVLIWAIFRFGSDAMASRLALLLMPIFFIYALGVNTPIFPWLFAHLPGVSAFRRPADAAFLLNFLVAIAIVGMDISGVRARPGLGGILLLMAVVGMACWLVPSLHEYAAQRGQLGELQHVLGSFSRRLAISAVLLLTAAMLSAYRPRLRVLCAVVLMAWATFDLSSAGRDSRFTGRVYALENAEAFRHPNRIAAMGGPLTDLNAALAGTNPYDGGQWRMEAIGGSMGANVPLMLGWAATQGYNPIKLRPYFEVFGAQNLQQEFKRFTPDAPRYDSAPYRWIGLRYVVFPQAIINRFQEFGENGRHLMDLRAALERDGASKNGLSGSRYEAWTLNGTMQKANLIEPDANDWAARPIAEGRCTIDSYRNTRVLVSCAAPRPARLVLNDTYAPGWRSCVNGVTAGLTPFGGVFRSVVLPAGKSIIEFLYEPVPFWRGTSCRPVSQG